MKWLHITTRLVSKGHRLDEHPIAIWLLGSWRRCFPGLLAGLVMPNHPHVVVPAETGALAIHGGILAALNREHWRGEGEWAATKHREIDDTSYLRTTTKYVHQNPAEAGYGHPLAYPYSTLRDVVGAVADPIVTANDLADALGYPRAGFVERWYRIISDKEPHPPPAPLPANLAVDRPLRDLACAVAAAFRTSPDAIRKRGSARATFVVLAWETGWRNTKLLAEFSGMSPSAVRRAVERSVPEEWLRAARLCLGDPRLLRWDVRGR